MRPTPVSSQGITQRKRITKRLGANTMVYEQLKIQTHFCLIIGKIGNALALVALVLVIFGGF
jgi:hypothetical protein